MKIYIVTPTENRLTKRGTRCPDLAEELAARGYQAVMVTSDFSHAYKRTFDAKEMADDKAKAPYEIVYVHSRGYKKNISLRRVFNNYETSRDIYRYLKKAVEKGDVVISPSCPVELTWQMSKLKKQGAKLICDIKDIWPGNLGSGLLNLPFKWYCNFYQNRSLKRYDRYVNVAPGFVDWLHGYVPNAESTFVPLGYKNERWEKVKLKEIKEGERIRFVFVGALQYQLDILPFIKAIGNNPRYELNIIGEDGHGQRYPEVIDYINKNEVKNVHFLGVVAPEKVPELLQECHIGLIPMISNSLINKIFDYLGAKIPIFVLDENDMARFVRNNNIGWTTSFDSKDIVKVLDGITASDINEAAKRVEEVRKDYGRDKIHQTYIEVIDAWLNE